MCTNENELESPLEYNIKIERVPEDKEIIRCGKPVSYEIKVFEGAEKKPVDLKTLAATNLFQIKLSSCKLRPCSITEGDVSGDFSFPSYLKTLFSVQDGNGSSDYPSTEAESKIYWMAKEDSEQPVEYLISADLLYRPNEDEKLCSDNLKEIVTPSVWGATYSAVKDNVIVKSIESIITNFPKPGESKPVSLQRTTEKPTKDISLWAVIQASIKRNGFKDFSLYVEKRLKGENRKDIPDKSRELNIYGDKNYKNIIQYAEDFFKENCLTLWDVDKVKDALKDDPILESKKVTGALADHLAGYNHMFPPYRNLKEKNEDIKDKLSSPLMMELIWSFWHEEGGLVQTMNAISLRFQNKRHPALKDPLLQMAIDPLRPLNNLLWGYIQNELNRLFLKRRAYEYNHQYGLIMKGKAIPILDPVDSRSKFIQSFHNLLYVCSLYYKEADDVTKYADAFPVLIGLRDLQGILGEGSHNQYGDMAWTSRLEMFVQMWILERPEMSDFLGGRRMVPYPEDWMRAVDAMKKIQKWTDVSITHFHNLAVWGEQILLSVRFGDWSNPETRTASAANWADYWRDQIQGYIHEYKTVTTVDLTRSGEANYEQPSVMIV